MVKKQNAEATATTNAQIIITRIKSVSFISDSNNYQLELENEFDAIIKDGDNYIEGRANKITFNARYFKYLILNKLLDLATIYEDCRERAEAEGVPFIFTAAKFNKYLKGAKVKIIRTRFNAGDEYADANGEVHQHNYAGYDTELVDITLDARGEKVLERDIDKI